MGFGTRKGRRTNGSGSGAASYDELRRVMVRDQIRSRGIVTPRLLEALLEVPRHEFIPEEFAHLAYADQPLPIGAGQTISQPFIVAAMTDALELTGSERVLEVGTGSGYQAALLAQLAREVFSIESHPELAREAEQRLHQMGYTNVRVRAGDGTLGWPEAAPFDGIIVTAAAPSLPPPLVEQLAEGGRLVIPVGEEHQQELLQVIRRGEEVVQRSLHYVRFVPLVGQYGWQRPPG